MERKLMITEDGSHTLFVNGMDEPYHSTHGALQESSHIFIKQGLHNIDRNFVSILELGFGTGLNALLTCIESVSLDLHIYYHAVEKYPLNESEYKMLNYEKLLSQSPKGLLHQLHSCPWGKRVQVSERFTLYKEKVDFRSMNPPANVNLIYLDAFYPDKQPQLWTPSLFGHIARLADPGAILVTYSSKGSVRRALTTSGFEVLKVAGPPGKREMIRAIKR